MAKYISGVNRNQIVLFPESIDDYISGDNDVRIIDTFVDSLDLVSLGFNFASLDPSKKGACPYDPRTLLKIYLYSYMKKIRSSRKIEAELHRNIELMWLANKLTPDHRTISDFRKNNPNALKKVLASFNVLCSDLNLFSADLVSLDGSKFKAVNSKENNFTRDKLIDRIKRIEIHISNFLDELDCNDATEVASISSSLKEKLNMWEQRKEQYNNLLKQLTDNDQNQVSLTDPDSKLMKCNGNMLVGYNVQVVSNPETHLIHDFDVTSDPSDNGKIYSSSINTKEALNADTLEVLADGGYRSNDDLVNCLENKIVPVLPDGAYSAAIDFVDNEITPEIKKGFSKDDVYKCLHTGVVPDCYSNLNLSLKVETIFSTEASDSSNISDDERLVIAKQGYFVRSTLNNSVFCPQGHTLKYLSSNKYDDIFIGDSFCESCPNKCCKENIRKLLLGKKKVIQGTPKYKTQTPRNNSSISRKKIVILTYIPDSEKYKLRKNTSEHPFGTIKRAHDASYFLTKGVDKVSGEMALSVLAYNLTRIKNLVGVEKLLEHLKDRKNKPVHA